MEKKQKKQILDVFCSSVNKEYQDYCSRHGFEQDSFETFITYAIDFNFIPSSTIQHYAIIQAYRDLQTTEMKKTEQVNRLADRFNLTSRSIWNILRKGT